MKSIQQTGIRCIVTVRVPVKLYENIPNPNPESPEGTQNCTVTRSGKVTPAFLSDNMK